MELLQIATALVITKCDGQLLQIATLSFFITKCETAYYKLRQVLQSVMDLLQSAMVLTNCDRTTSAYTEFMSGEGFC